MNRDVSQCGSYDRASFPNDMVQVIQSTTNYHLLPLPSGCPQRLEPHAHVMVELHEWVEVINMFWLVGCFNEAGGGNAAIIGDPDFSWVMGRATH